MKRIIFPVLGLLCALILGCSIPMTAKYSQIDTFSSGKTQKKSKFSIFKPTARPEDFLGNKVNKDDIASAKEKVEKYILAHNDLDEAARNYLRDLKVVRGATAQEVELLLGKPTKIIKSGKNVRPALEVWVYKTNKASPFRILIIHIFSIKETYYLYFKENILMDIKKHYLKQAVGNRSLPGQ
jgi:hypothetical protein